MSDRKTEEFLIVAWAEPASGPGWANSPIRAIVQEVGGGPMRHIWLQPDEQTAEMQTLYRINAASTDQMTKAVATKLRMSRGI